MDYKEADRILSCVMDRLQKERERQGVSLQKLGGLTPAIAAGPPPCRRIGRSVRIVDLGAVTLAKEAAMPRASWKGFLRLSLVSCPIYLSPAATRTKSIRLHQVWQPKAMPRAQDEEDDEEDQTGQFARRSPVEPVRGELPQESSAPARVALRPHDPHTGEEIERDEVVRGYEFERGRFVTFTADELKALDVESSKIIDLDTFVPRAELDPVYFSTPYYVYPDGPIAVETFRVIGAAMEEAGTAGIGRVTLSRRERPVIVEPRGAGMVLITLRAAEEVRAPAFAQSDGELDPDMVAIAATIIRRRGGRFDPATFRDRYQEALRELIEAKIKGLPVRPKRIVSPPPVVDLMAALKRSLAQETAQETAKGQPKRRAAGDRRQASLLLPVSGKKQETATPAPAKAAPQRRRKA
jgi:DNA end-binding protein Ku